MLRAFKNRTLLNWISLAIWHKIGKDILLMTLGSYIAHLQASWRPLVTDNACCHRVQEAVER